MPSIHDERDIELVKNANRLLEVENQRLHAMLAEMNERLAKLEGKEPAEQLELQMELGKAAASEVFGRITPVVNRIGWQHAFASSGTVKMMAYICESHGYGERQVQLDALHALKGKLAQSISGKQNLAGLNERRRDLLLAGWCILTALMEAYQVESLDFSATALREGMLDFMVKNEKTLQAMSKSNLPAVTQAG